MFKIRKGTRLHVTRCDGRADTKKLKSGEMVWHDMSAVRDLEFDSFDLIPSGDRIVNADHGSYHEFRLPKNDRGYKRLVIQTQLVISRDSYTCARCDKELEAVFPDVDYCDECEGK